VSKTLEIIEQYVARCAKYVTYWSKIILKSTAIHEKQTIRLILQIIRIFDKMLFYDGKIKFNNG
jgi:hypothetical protein